MLKLKLQYFGHLTQRADSLEKTLMLGGIGGRKRRTTEDEMAGWHHWLDGREAEWTLGVGDGQGGLVCCDSWGHKESDTTERLNWTELSTGYIIVLVKFPNTCPTLSPCFDLGVYLGKGWSYRAILAKHPCGAKWTIIPSVTHQRPGCMVTSPTDYYKPVNGFLILSHQPICQLERNQP